MRKRFPPIIHGSRELTIFGDGIDVCKCGMARDQFEILACERCGGRCCDSCLTDCRDCGKMICEDCRGLVYRNLCFKCCKKEQEITKASRINRKDKVFLVVGDIEYRVKEGAEYLVDRTDYYNQKDRADMIDIKGLGLLKIISRRVSSQGARKGLIYYIKCESVIV